MFKDLKNLGQVMMDLFTSHPSITEAQKQKISEAATADITALVPTQPSGDGKGAREGESVQTAAEQTQSDSVESLRAALATANTEKNNLSSHLKTAQEEAGRYKVDAGKYNEIKGQYEILNTWYDNHKASMGVVTQDGNSGSGKNAGGLSEKTIAAQEEKERLKTEYPDLMKDID